MQVTTEKLPGMLQTVLEAGLVPMISGSPGVGKSDIVRQVAENNKLKVIDLRLSQCDPTDLSGFPSIKGDVATYVPMDTFPIESTPIPNGYKGWLIFLDELTSAPLSVQAAAYKLVLDRVVGQHPLHKNVAIIGAGNLATDKAIVTRMSTAMQSRMAHFELVVDADSWRKWAANTGIDYRIISFIGFKPAILHSFKPNHNGSTFPSPRTWEFMHRIVKKHEEIHPDLLPTMAAVVDEAAAREFFAYAKIFKTLITKEQILRDPTGIEVPTEPSVQYALAGSLGQYIDKNNADKLMQFIGRMNIEMQIITLQVAIGVNKDLKTIPAILTWLRINSKNLF